MMIADYGQAFAAVRFTGRGHQLDSCVIPAADLVGQHYVRNAIWWRGGWHYVELRKVQA